MEEFSPISRNGLGLSPPPEPGPGQQGGNFTMFETPDSNLSVTPVLQESTICDMLLNAPVPPRVDEIPFFCMCSHCKGTKGDRGDRGLPGMGTTLHYLFELSCVFVRLLLHQDIKQFVVMAAREWLLLMQVKHWHCNETISKIIKCYV